MHHVRAASRDRALRQGTRKRSSSTPGLHIARCKSDPCCCDSRSSRGSAYAQRVVEEDDSSAARSSPHRAHRVVSCAAASVRCAVPTLASLGGGGPGSLVHWLPSATLCASIAASRLSALSAERVAARRDPALLPIVGVLVAILHDAVPHCSEGATSRAGSSLLRLASGETRRLVAARCLQKHDGLLLPRHLDTAS